MRKVAFVLFFLAISIGSTRGWGDPSQTGATLNINHVDHAYKRIDDLLTALPDGTDLDNNQFVAATGGDASQYLTLIAANRLTSRNGTLNMTLDAAFSTVTPRGNKIRLATRVSMAFHKEADGTIIFDHVSGIEVKSRFLPFWLPLSKITVASDTRGSTTFRVALGTIFGNVSYSSTVSADGAVT